MVVTLYRKGAKGFDKKEAKFSVKEEIGSKLKKVGAFTVDLANYASMDGQTFTVDIPLDASHKDGPCLRISFSSTYLKDYSGVDDDVASQMTDMSRLSGAHSEASDRSNDQNLDDFPELNDDDIGGGGGGGDSSATTPGKGGYEYGGKAPGGGGRGSDASGGLPPRAPAITVTSAVAAGSSAAAFSSSAASSGGAEPGSPYQRADAGGDSSSMSRPTGRKYSANDSVAKLQRENAELRNQVAQLLSSGSPSSRVPDDDSQAKRIADLTEEVAFLQQKLDEGEVEWSKCQADLQRTHDANKKLNDEIEMLQEQVELQKEEINTKKVKTAPAAAAAAATVAAVAAPAANTAALEAKVRELQANVSRLEAENKSLEEVMEPLQEEHDAAVARAADLAKRVASLEKAAAAAAAGSGAAAGGSKPHGDAKDSSTSSAALASLRAEHDSLIADKARLESRVQSLEEELSMTRDHMADLQKTSATLATELGEMRSRANSVTDKDPKNSVPELRGKIRVLEAEVAK